MQARQVTRAASSGGDRSWVLVFATGDDPSDGLLTFAKEHGLVAAHLTGIGAFSQVDLGFYDIEAKQYRRNEVHEQVEVVSLVGDIATKATDRGDEPVVHVHVVVAGSDALARGGHLLGARVRPTLEVVVTETAGHLRRRHDDASGLALIDLTVSDPAVSDSTVDDSAVSDGG
jgi:predicted DNA-binding protein with PD1-like motif